MNHLLRIARSTPVRAGFLLLAVGAALFFVVNQWDLFTAALRDVGVSRIVQAGLISILYVLATALSWRAILADLGTRLPAAAAMRIFFVSQVAKYLPGGVWNIVAAAELGADHEIPRRRSAAVMAISLLVSVVTGAILAVIGLLTSPEAREFAWVAFAIPVGLVLLAPPVLGRLADFGLRLMRRDPLGHRPSWRGLSVGIAWQVVAWLLAGAQVFLLAEPLGLSGDVLGFLVATGGYALAWTAGFLFIVVPAGVGMREIVLAAALAGSLTVADATTVVLISRIVLTFVDLGAGGAAALAARWSGTRRSR